MNFSESPKKRIVGNLENPTQVQQCAFIKHFCTSTKAASLLRSCCSVSLIWIIRKGIKEISVRNEQYVYSAGPLTEEAMLELNWSVID